MGHSFHSLSFPAGHRAGCSLFPFAAGHLSLLPPTPCFAYAHCLKSIFIVVSLPRGQRSAGGTTAERDSHRVERERDMGSKG